MSVTVNEYKPPSAEYWARLKGVAAIRDAKVEENDEWIARFQKQEDFLVICARRPVGLVWYGVASNPGKLWELREMVLGFVGPSYSSFQGGLTRLDPDSALESVLSEGFGAQAIKLDCGGRSTDEDATRRSFRLMFNVLEGAALPRMEESYSSGPLLRDFYMALRSGNRKSAETILNLLHEHFLVSEPNLAFLKVQLLAELEQWQEMLSLPVFDELVRVRRPPMVSQAMIRALYQTHLSPLERAANHKGALAAFTQDVLPRSGTLLGHHTGLEHPDCLHAFMYLSVATKSVRLRDEILVKAKQVTKDTKEYETIASLFPATETTAPAPSGPDVEKAQAFFNEGDVDQAYQTVRTLPATVEKASLLLDCAYEIQTLDVTKDALEATGGLSTQDQELLLKNPRLKRYWSELQATVSVSEAKVTSIPQGWMEWFALLKDPGELDLRQIALRGGSEWAHSELSSEDIQSLAGYFIEEWPPDARDCLLDSLSHIVGFLQRDPEYPNRRYGNVYDAILIFLATEHRGNPQALGLLGELLRTLLDVGLDPKEYERSVDDFLRVWGSVKAPRSVPWLFDVLETLMDYPCPSPDRRLGVCRTILNLSPLYLGRLSEIEWDVLRVICEELGIAEEYKACRARGPVEEKPAEEEASSVWPLLENRKVGIYTLTERAGKQARDLIVKRVPTCQVSLNNDLVQTASLKDMAVNSDVVVMVARAAKHAATNAIKDLRGGKPLVIPNGKGASSIMRSLEEYLGRDPQFS